MGSEAIASFERILIEVELPAITNSDTQLCQHLKLPATHAGIQATVQHRINPRSHSITQQQPCRISSGIVSALAGDRRNQRIKSANKRSERARDTAGILAYVQLHRVLADTS